MGYTRAPGAKVAPRLIEALVGGPPTVERVISAVVEASVKPLTAKIEALPQSLMMAGVPTARASPASFSTRIESAGFTVADTRMDGEPAGMVRTTTMSLSGVALGISAASRAGVQVPPE